MIDARYRARLTMALRILPRLLLGERSWAEVTRLLDVLLGALRAGDETALRSALARLEQLGAVRSGMPGLPTGPGVDQDSRDGRPTPPPAAVRARLARVADEVAGAPSEPVRRALSAEMPQRVGTGQRVSLLVRVVVVTDPGARGQLAGLGEVPPEGRTIVVTVSSRGLQPDGDTIQDLLVPAGGDSDPVLFTFRTMGTGPQTVHVTAFAGGTFLGEIEAHVLVEASAGAVRNQVVRGDLPLTATEPGEVTLQVRRLGDQYHVQLLGGSLSPFEISPLAGDPEATTQRLADQLKTMARAAGSTSGQVARNRLQNLGAKLWGELVPAPIREQFWSQAADISAFTVASHLDVIPWELLYPVDGSAENGFLAEQFPVLRRVYGQGRARVLNLGASAFVVPAGSPADALDEVRAVRSTLGVADDPVLDRLTMVNEALKSGQLGLLHFACHNAFAADSGSSIAFRDGTYTPDDLSLLVQRTALRERAPLIFLNACRTAGEVRGLTDLSGWASQFMRAGAGAFVGTLWAVRSSTARRFAEEFYRQLASADRSSLGAASLAARRAIADESGDPTWLAYSVYGNPSARARGVPAGTG